MHFNTKDSGRSVLVAVALLLSLASIFIAYDFGTGFAGRLRWCYASPISVQSVAVVIGVLCALMIARWKSGALLAPVSLVSGLVVLWLPFSELLGFSVNGTHRWIGLSPQFHFPADLVGILLMLPQMARWVAGDGLHRVRTGLFAEFRQWATPWIRFGIIVPCASVLLFAQNNPSGLVIFSCIVVVLCRIGQLNRNYFVPLAVALCLIVAVRSASGIRNVCLQYEQRGLTPALFNKGGWSQKRFNAMAQKRDGQAWWVGSWGSFPRPVWSYRPKPSEFCEYVADVVQLRAGFIGAGLLVAAAGIFCVASMRMVFSARSLESKARIAAASTYLCVPMAISLVRTLTETRLLPSTPFPFLGYGVAVTVTAWATLGWLLRDTRPVSGD